MRSRHVAQQPEPGTSPSQSSYLRRRRRYFVLMSICLVLFVGAWALVRLWSVPVAIGMCVVAMVIPPVAAVVGNKRAPDEPWWDEEEDRSGPGDTPRGYDDRR